MAGRIRTVKPEWLEDEELLRAGEDARVLSIALLLMADDHGRGRYIEESMGPQVFPFAREPVAKFREAVARLSNMGFVVGYEVRRQRYFEIVNWKKHQRVDRPGNPRVPLPLDEARETLGTASRGPRETLAPDPDLIPHTSYPEGEREGEHGATAPLAPSAPAAPKPSSLRKPPAAQQALGAALKRAMPVPPQLSRSLREKAAKRLTDAVAAGVASDLDAAADVLVAAWQKLDTSNAWKLCDVPISAPKPKPSYPRLEDNCDIFREVADGE